MSETEPLPSGLPKRYQWQELLGRGGMGRVFAAFDTTIRRRVAIKLADPPIPGDPESMAAFQRFRREAQVAGGLKHEHIVGVYDFGEEQGTGWMVMELVEGGSLRDLIRGGTRLTLPEIVRLVVQVLDALAHCHDQGVIHCDIKPANIMLTVATSSGEVKLTDFGIARSRPEFADDVTVVAGARPPAESFIGTPAYMAPEQAKSLPFDHRVDIWATGVLLYELLTEKKPFTGDHPDAVTQAILTTEPEPPSRISFLATPAFDAVLARALAKDPAKRYPDARAFAAGLLEAARARRGDETRATAVAPPPAAPTPPAKKGGVSPALLAGAGLAVAAVVGAVIFLLPGGQAPPAPPQQQQALVLTPPSPQPEAPPAPALQTPPVAEPRPESASPPAPPVTQPQPPSEAPPAPPIAQPRPEPPPAPPVTPPPQAQPRPEPPVVQPRPEPEPPVVQPRPEPPPPVAQPRPEPPAPPVAQPRPEPSAPPVTQPRPEPPPPPVAQPRPEPPPPVAQPRPEPPPPVLVQPQAPVLVPAPAPAAILADILGRVRCGVVSQAPEGSGFVVNGFLHQDDATALRRAAAEANLTLRLAADVFDAPYCDVLAAIRPITAAPGAGLEVEPRARLLRRNDQMELALQMPPWAAHLNIWFVMHDGNALQLIRERPMAPGARVNMRETSPDFPWIIDEPFGLELVLVVASERPLFATPRPDEETVPALAAALEQARRGAGGQVAARAVMVETRAR
ncbi:serine/threonine-protein kinase [Roseococcus suduntuyensis]|uniref:non-specific serine/threonine protein kinase n=1 Tax=Roseococcus suduntuyensis TaxID=455361 RepID=A0A840A5U7_9PROT|nr:serine/threonine-protein kinase [Roseococcus suduntuyensis]MBB3896611.1 serine/threonine-protein kinase [Roseococcus suduntuyensis]